MAEPVLTADEMLAWLEKTSMNWRALVEEHPEILVLPCDVMGVGTVGALLQHIVAVEVRYAEQLSGLPVTEYEAIPFDSAAAIYATHVRGVGLLRKQLASGVDWDETIDLKTRSMGPLRASRKTVFFHATMHSIRHYAQLATLVRQHGIKPGWQMDYLMMGVERV
ncbi:MAG: damage-inducible protein DinB [Acidobacteriota bacterium]|nr:damage-inducible protein DinB [Acidobacteriota bacterium]